MKKFTLRTLFMSIVFLMPFMADAQTYEVYKKDGEVVIYDYNNVDSIVFKAKKEIPNAIELQKTWEAQGSIFDIDSKGVCYQLDYNSYDGFAHTDNGDYVTIPIREYCEEFAKDWNADSKNDRKITAEEAADREFDGLFTRFIIDENTLEMHQGTKYGDDVEMINGTYTYDEKTGIIKVQDTIDCTEKTIVVSIDNKDRVNFLINSEWYTFSTSSYDNSIDYWIFCPTFYYCSK